MINTTEASISACIGIISGVIICVILFWPKTETCIPTKKYYALRYVSEGYEEVTILGKNTDKQGIVYVLIKFHNGYITKVQEDKIFTIDTQDKTVNNGGNNDNQVST